MSIGVHSNVNPNPITKLFVVVILGFTVLHSINIYFEWSIIVLISLMYLINGYKKQAINNILVYIVMFIVPYIGLISEFNAFIKMFFSLFLVFRMFYVPFSAGKFMICTSDVGSVISSMDRLKIPKEFSIPISVMFRFFPSFKEERKNIRMAMKIKGIHTRNPIKYLEYIAVPLLIMSSNIVDDISKAAETKCIESPLKKTRYTKVCMRKVDLVYSMLMLLMLLGGWLC